MANEVAELLGASALLDAIADALALHDAKEAAEVVNGHSEVMEG